MQVTGFSETVQGTEYTTELVVQIGDTRYAVTKKAGGFSARDTAMLRQSIRRQCWDEMMAKIRLDLLKTLGGY